MGPNDGKKLPAKETELGAENIQNWREASLVVYLSKVWHLAIQWEKNINKKMNNEIIK